MQTSAGNLNVSYKRRRSISKTIIRNKYLLILFLPTLLYFIIFKYVPMFGILIGFKDYSISKGVWASEWVGLKHYQQFFSMPGAWRIIRNTLILGFYTTFFGFWPPILLALLLNEVRNKLYKRFVQTVSYLPHFLSTVIVVSMVTVFLAPDGFVNEVLKFMGFESINFMLIPDLFRSIYVSSGIWQSIGWGSIIYLAALSGVDPQLYEAAEMDGAGRFHKAWHITLPALVPAIVIILILDIAKLLEIGFEKVYLLYNPVTYETADIIQTFVYRMGIEGGNYSMAAAIDVFTGVVGLILILIVNYVSKKLTENSLW